MSPRAAGTVFGLDGSSYRLLQEIGSGGQGSVWSLDGEPALVAKFYHKGFAAQDLAKLSAMCRLRTEPLSRVTAWPLTLLKESRTGDPQGLLMRRIAGYKSVHQLYGLKSRLRGFPEAQFPFLVHTAINTARSFSTIHDAGQVIGDVNHSNLMISQTATVAMIDCDSFQITDGKTVFPCPVGVPEFTPPELQGITFATQRRTVQHDAFGLSILIFYLLFLGRHPYMGSYDPTAGDIRTLDRAIAEYRFPYALSDQSPEVRLPPFVPRLSAYPSEVGDLFKRAFTRDALTHSRPSAEEWVRSLSSLAAATKRCSANPNHDYYNGLKDCPWCRVEGAIGSAIFGFRIGLVRDTSFNLIAVWAQIETVNPEPEALAKPDPRTLRSQFSVNPRIPQIAKQRRLFRFGSVGLVLSASVVAVAELVPLVAVLIIIIALIFGKKLWSKGAYLSREFDDAYIDLSHKCKAAESLFDQNSATPATFTGEKHRLEAVKAEYQGLAPSKAKAIGALNATREQKQLQHFLEGFRIEDENIPNIGPKNKLLLKAWGIEDAWDVQPDRVAQVKGFGPVRKQAIADWRAGKLRQFHFDATQPVDPRDLHALEQEFAQKGASLRSSLTAGPQALRQAVSVWQSQRKQSFATFVAFANLLAQAEVNRHALRTF
jgi:DNA-binding helix-hairpin-helix protein with protein kinase domain